MLRKKAIVLVCTLIVLMLISISVLAEGARPFTGTYLKDTIGIGNGELEIINDNPQMDAVAVLKDTTDKRAYAGDLYSIKRIIYIFGDCGRIIQPILRDR